MNTFLKSENLPTHSEKVASDVSRHEAVVPLSLHESIVAEHVMRIKEQAARIDEQATLVAELKIALNSERQKRSEGAGAVKQGTLHAVQKQSRFVGSQLFWALVSAFVALAPASFLAFYHAHPNFVWTIGFMALYVGSCLFVLYLAGRYAFRSLQKAYQSGPVPFCNTVFVYGAIIALAGVMETLSSLSRGQFGSLTGMIVMGLLVCGGSFGFGKRKMAGSAERFPDLQAARRFM